MKVFQAESMDEAALREFTSRPRIDFTSILGTVSGPRGGAGKAAATTAAAAARTSTWDFSGSLAS